MKTLALAILLFTSIAAHAVDLEVGIGFNNAHIAPNGTWYQEGFPYSVNLKSKIWSIGVSDDINRNWKWRVEYVNLGIFRSDAIATPVDANYNPNNNPPCNGPCVAESRFVGNGSANGISTLVEYHTTGDIQYGISGGINWSYKIWRESVYGWTWSRDVPGKTIDVSIPERLTPNLTFGVSIKKENHELRLDQYFNRCLPSAYACIWDKMTTVRYVYHFNM